MTACGFVPQHEMFASGVMAFLDCQAEALGTSGYQALATSNSLVGAALAGMLTLFVALVGYRLMFGEMLTARDGIVHLVKIGAVIALATSWPAYRTLVYDIVLRAPGELAGAVAAPETASLSTRLDAVDQQLDALLFIIRAPATFRPVDPQNALRSEQIPGQGTLSVAASQDAALVRTVRAVFLVGAIGVFGFARLGGGLLLALGPLFIALLLFDVTQGLFAGWVRALVGTALVSFAAAVLLNIELSMLEPWLAQLIADPGRFPVAGSSAQLLAATVVFALLLGSIGAIMMRVALGFRLPARPLSYPVLPPHAAGHAGAVEAGWTTQARDSEPTEARSRARQIADALVATQRREAASADGRVAGPGGTAGIAAGGRDNGSTQATPFGQNARRRVSNRISGSAAQRDRRA